MQIRPEGVFQRVKGTRPQGGFADNPLCIEGSSKQRVASVHILLAINWRPVGGGVEKRIWATAEVGRLPGVRQKMRRRFLGKNL